MLKSGISAAAILGAILWANAALAGSLTCKAEVHSPQAGSVVMAWVNPAPATAASAFNLPGEGEANWYPPASGDAVIFEVGFDGRMLEHMRPANMHVEIAQVSGLAPEQFTARVSGDGLRTVELEGAAVDIMTHRYALPFNWGHAADRAMAQAVANGARVKIDVFRSDKRVMAEMFNGVPMRLIVAGPPQQVASAVIDTTALEARKALFAQMQHLIETSDAAVCKPAS